MQWTACTIYMHIYIYIKCVYVCVYMSFSSTLEHRGLCCLWGLLVWNMRQGILMTDEEKREKTRNEFRTHYTSMNVQYNQLVQEYLTCNIKLRIHVTSEVYSRMVFKIKCLWPPDSLHVQVLYMPTVGSNFSTFFLWSSASQIWCFCIHKIVFPPSDAHHMTSRKTEQII